MTVREPVNIDGTTSAIIFGIIVVIMTVACTIDIIRTRRRMNKKERKK